MANPTTNYGFVLPTPTDLVTDLPADFDVALQGVDTQMLTNANAAIAKTIVDSKGDIIAATGADAVSRLAVGANDTILTADSSTATGLKWAAAAAGGMTSIASGSLSGTALNLTSISASYKDLRLILRGVSLTASTTLGLTVNNTTFIYTTGNPSNNAMTGPYNIADATAFTAAYATAYVQVDLYDYANTSHLKKIMNTTVVQIAATPTYWSDNLNGAANLTAAIDRITITVAGGNSYDAGTYILYGVN